MKFGLASSFFLASVLFLTGCAETYRQASTTGGGASTDNQVISSQPTNGPSYGTSYGLTNGSYHYATNELPSASGQVVSQDTDSALALRVKDALASNTAISGAAQGVQTTARGGAVTLSGAVPSDNDRQAIDNVVRNLPGVTSVYDQLQVRPSATGRVESPGTGGSTQGALTQQTMARQAPASTDIFSLHVQGLNDTDRSLAQKILQGLQSDAGVNSIMPRVDINVTGGKVMLQGIVQSELQKQAIGSAVERAAGVNNVENNLQVSDR